MGQRITNDRLAVAHSVIFIVDSTFDGLPGKFQLLQGFRTALLNIGQVLIDLGLGHTFAIYSFQADGVVNFATRRTFAAEVSFPHM